MLDTDRDSLSDVKEEKGKKGKGIGIRVSEEEFRAWKDFIAKLNENEKGTIPDTQVIRELLGFSPPRVLEEVNIGEVRRKRLLGKGGTGAPGVQKPRIIKQGPRN